MREHTFNIDSIPLTTESIASYNVLLLAMKHKAFDCDLIKKCKAHY
ncbi:hypothetical protein AAKU55_005044 [Oxalobacteraceae bacterium GrIS 1.11]